MQEELQRILKANMNEIIKNLIRGFDWEHGCPSATFQATMRLVTQEWGARSAMLFDEAVDSCDGGFYIGEDSAEELISAMEGVKD